MKKESYNYFSFLLFNSIFISNSSLKSLSAIRFVNVPASVIKFVEEYGIDVLCF